MNKWIIKVGMEGGFKFSEIINADSYEDAFQIVKSWRDNIVKGCKIIYLEMETITERRML